jgi:hypothetical protein
MTAIITITEAIRTLPYFCDFKEEQVEVPDKPFLKELLDKTVSFKGLSKKELCDCIETCIYFTLDTSRAVEELLWKIGKYKGTFRRWFGYRMFIASSQPVETWTMGEKFPALIRAEINKKFGSRLDKGQLIKMGIRTIDQTIIEIVSRGNLRLLKWFIKEKRCWGLIDACAQAAKHGHLECLRYLHEQGCPWDVLTCLEAAREGHLDCLKYAHENGCPGASRTIIEVAAHNGHLDCLQYLHEKGSSYVSSGDIHLCSLTVQGGNLACLKYLHEQGYGWDKRTCGNAAENGHLNCLQYAHENGCPWDFPEIYTIACLNAHIDCMEYIWNKRGPDFKNDYISS